MTKERSICFNCKHWAVEPGVLGQRKRIIAKKMAGEKVEVPAATYGHCTVAYEYVGDNKIELKKGTLASTPCSVNDDNGNVLFELVPED